jgi:hypothetical protein
MTPQHPWWDELRALLDALCEEQIDEAQAARLEEIVLSSPEAEACYIEYLHLHAGFLHEFGGTPASLDAARPVPLFPGAVPPPGARRARRGPAWLGRAARWTASAAAAAVLAVGLRLALPRPGGPAPQALGRPAEAPAVAPASAGGEVEGFALVAALDRVAWDPGSARWPSRGDLLGVGRLALRSGRVTLAMVNGVTVTVEGPADFDVRSIDRVHCRRGKLRAHVPDGAEGFVVSTPGSVVVDLGTEFGLNVAADGRAEVMVFEGKAEAAVLNAAGSPMRSRLVERNDALAIDPGQGQIARAAPRPGDYVGLPDFTPPPLTLDPGYPAAVLASEPWGYWRFGPDAHGEFRNEVPGRPPLRSRGRGPVVSAEAGPGNRCAEFGPDVLDRYLEMDGLWRPHHDRGHAIEFWFLTERYAHTALVSLIEPGPPSDDYNHLGLVELTSTERQSVLPPLSPPASVRFLHRWPPGDAGGDNLFSPGYYQPYRWHHIVAQRSGGKMELFLDGQPSDPIVSDSEMASEPCRLVVGRLKPDPRPEGRVHSRPLAGRLDELAVYNHPLTAEQVQRHFNLGSPGRGPF